MSIIKVPESLQAAMQGGAGQVVVQPHPSNVPLSDQHFDVDVQDGKVRWVTVTQLFFLNMSIPFSSPGAASEQRSASTDQQNFPLFMRAAWTNMEAVDVLALLKTSRQNLNWSTRPVLIGSIAGRSTLVNPLLYYRRGFRLEPQSTINGDFTNSPTAPEDGESRIVWLCERPEKQARVPVSRSMDFRLDVQLNLAGGPTGTDQRTTMQVSEPVLIYGAITDADPGTLIRITDTESNIGWSSSLLPIGAFAGIDDGSDVQPIVRYPKPYLLNPNASLQIDWLNAGDDTGKYIVFLGERILSQNGPIDVGPQPPTQTVPIQPQPPQSPVMPAPPGGPILQPQIPFSECQRIYEGDVLGYLDPRFPNREAQTLFIRHCKDRGLLNLELELRDGKLYPKQNPFGQRQRRIK